MKNLPIKAKLCYDINSDLSKNGVEIKNNVRRGNMLEKILEQYDIPSILTMNDGQRCSNQEMWEKRRKEILDFFPQKFMESCRRRRPNHALQ